MIEEWRPVVGFECYQVSNLGRIRAAAKILKPQPSRGGYLFVQLSPGQVSKYVHQLVLEAFVGPRPPGLEGEHDDRDRTNNRLSNLAWKTHSENNLNKPLYARSTSGIRGVTYVKDRNKWVAQTSVDQRHKTIGYFDTKEEAAEAYVKFTGRT